jgi:predicted HicB family RNase H-like nuclease
MVGKPRKFVDGEARITAKVSPALHDQAVEKAAAEGRTLSEIVRRLLFSWLSGEKKTPENPPK